MHFTSLFLGLLGLALPLGAVPSAGVQILEQLPEIPSGWTQGPAPSPSQLMKFRIAVHVEQAASFEQRVIDISTPGHPEYGNHLEHHEVKAFLRPSTDVSTSILSWLESEQVSNENIEDDGDWITFVVPVSKAERMMNTRFYYFRHDETDARNIRTLQYSIPKSLHGSIDFIQPTTRFGGMQAQRATVIERIKAPTDKKFTAGYDPTFCNYTVTPDCLRGLYGMGNYTAKSCSSNSLGISGYLGQLARFNDLAMFSQRFAPEMTTNFTVMTLNNGTDDQLYRHDAAEANLDVQYAMALAGDTQTYFYSTGGLGYLDPDRDQPTQDDNQNEPYLEQLSYLLALPSSQIPKVLSTSYGENEQSVPAAYAVRVCNLFAQLGSRGVSVIFSSGDSGVGDSCQTNDGTNSTRFLPNFPAACPFVTSVGGTYHVEPEVAVSFSSGGFSDLFPRPSYQDADVLQYLANLGDTWSGLYNPAGRGYPDVAAQAVNFSIYEDGYLSMLAGTSASAPVFAGIISALNSIRLRYGRPSLGFLNPWIYSRGSYGFTDITQGGSKGCTGYSNAGLRSKLVPFASWNATSGWDPVTGLGTPYFPDLVRLMP